MTIGPLQLIRQATPGQRRTLLAASMGWALDAFDAMIYSLVLALLMRDLGMSKTLAGSLGTLTLLASGIGGVLFGFLADRIGRKQALMASILTYSVCSFASGLATSIAMLAVARFVLGLGMGGEWNTGATLVAESWPTEFRAKAISIVQSSWALGFAAAALVAGPVARYYGWRAVFFVGILPAVITLWIQRSVPESEMWRERQSTAGGQGLAARRGDVTSYVSTKFSVIFRPPYVKHTFALLFFNFFGMFAWWGLFTWLPPYLSASGGSGRAWVRRHGHDDANGRAELVRNVSGVCQFRMGSRPSGSTQGLSDLYVSGSCSDSTLCRGAIAKRAAGARHSGRVFRDRNIFWLGDHGQRDLPYCSTSTRSRVHLQRSADAKLRCSVGDWTCGANEGFELGVLFVRGGIFAGGADDHAVAGDEGEESGIKVSFGPHSIGSTSTRSSCA